MADVQSTQNPVSNSRRFSLKMSPLQSRRFWAKVDKSDPAGCWLWTGARNSQHGWNTDGYGSMLLNYKTVRPHRVSYTEAYGDIPDDLVLDHIACISTLCVRPDHLRAVTNKQNLENIRREPIAASGYRGVSERTFVKWDAFVVHNSKQFYLGRFADPKDAAEAARLARHIIYTHSDDAQMTRGVTPERSAWLRARIVTRLIHHGLLERQDAA